MDFRVLGPLEVVRNGQPLALGGSKQRAVLAVLLLHANETVSTDRLIDALWGESAPSGAVQSVRVHVSRLRKVLEHGHSEGGAPSVLVTTAGGYELRVEDGDFDLVRFKRLLAEGQKELAGEQPERAAKLLDEALRIVARRGARATWPSSRSPRPRPPGSTSSGSWRSRTGSRPA